jgi:hypothetical protein
MATWQDFTKGIIAFAAPKVFPHHQDSGSLEVGKSSDTGQSQQSDPLFAKIFGGFMEICDTLEIMKDVEVYIRQFPFSRSGIPRSRYLKFLIHAYLNEVYVLRERLLSYSKVLEKTYRKDSRGPQIAAAAEKARLTVKKTLSNIVFVRGAHVHDTRFTDEQISHFSGTELIVTHAEPCELGPSDRRYAEWEYKELRGNWVKRIKEINEVVLKLLDAYAALLYDIAFDTAGRFINPNAEHSTSMAPNSSAAPDASRALRGRLR